MKDKEIDKLIQAEAKRQKSVVNLIASENYVSDDVLEALGSVLTNKYAEGYPGARYYGGNEIIDKVETLAKKRALETFGLSENEWSINVQALSGSPANLAVYLALVPPHEKVMGMSLDHGGHLTHGHKVSATGKIWTQVPYGVSKNDVLDYEEIKKKAIEEKPKMIIAGFTAYPRVIDWKKFREIADACGAYLMVDMSHLAGLVAGGAYPSPFPYADIVTTTVHKTLRGPRSALIFSKKDIRELGKKIDKAIFPDFRVVRTKTRLPQLPLHSKKLKVLNLKNTPNKLFSMRESSRTSFRASVGALFLVVRIRISSSLIFSARLVMEAKRQARDSNERELS